MPRHSAAQVGIDTPAALCFAALHNELSKTMLINIGDHVDLGTEMKPHRGIVVDVSRGGEAAIIEWDVGHRTVIATKLFSLAGQTNAAEELLADSDR